MVSIRWAGRDQEIRMVSTRGVDRYRGFRGRATRGEQPPGSWAQVGATEREVWAQRVTRAGVGEGDLACGVGGVRWGERWGRRRCGRHLGGGW